MIPIKTNEIDFDKLLSIKLKCKSFAKEYADLKSEFMIEKEIIASCYRTQAIVKKHRGNACIRE